MSLGTIILLLLVLMLLGVVPTWLHSRSWGYAPRGALGTMLGVVVILWDDIHAQQVGPAENTGRNVDQTLEEAGKKTEKTGDAIKDKVENSSSAPDDASINNGYKNENRQLQP